MPIRPNIRILKFRSKNQFTEQNMAIKTCKIKFEKVLAFMSNWYQFFDFLAC